MSTEAATPTEQFIYEEVKRRYDFEFERARDLDNKAGNLVGWIGLIISIILAGGGILFTRTNEGKVQLSQADIQLLSAALLLLVFALLFGLIAFRVMRFDVVPEPQPLMRYGTRTQRATLRAVTAEMARAIVKNSNTNIIKAHLVTVTWGLFFTGIALTVIFIITQYSKLT